MGNFYFAQITDLHLGKGLNPKEAAHNLRWALKELISFNPRPKLVLVTGDLVCGGTAAELLEYRNLTEGYALPLYHLPANHDLWGEPDAQAWKKIIGPLWQSVDVGELRFLLWNDIQRTSNGKWRAEIRPEQSAWIEDQLSTWTPKPSIIAFHSPILPIGGNYHDTWCNSNANEFLDLLSRHNVIAMITGHWHRNGEWMVNGIPLINTGALCGWQWNGTPPHYCFPVRPGYRLFWFGDGKLRSFWREGSYWTTPAPRVQVTLVWIGPAHTGGPRPQVRPIDIFGRVRLTAKAYAVKDKIVKVEWSLVKDEWLPMEQTFQGIWSEWEAELDPTKFRATGELTCIVRAETEKGLKAYDAVPIRLSERECSARTSTPSQEGREMVFELFYLPE